jgi:uncharacterized protein
MQDKLQKLRSILGQMGSALVCYSGGVDSSFLLRVTADTLGGQIVRDSRELARPDYARNPTDRCFFCKTELMRLAEETATREGLQQILMGTNADEIAGHRPGLRAANDGGARHPLVEAGLTKAEIRALSKDLGLPTWNKPQLACLASRFPYGTAITAERLGRVEAFEAGLEDLGFEGTRVRFHETIARLELPAEQLPLAVDPQRRQRIVELGRRLGFTYVTVDLQGYRTGAMNEVLPSSEAAPDPDEVTRARSKR